jgi:N-acetyl-1-D-myo-inositol-2-amino-2-deoxy-alpha-D-glucopyranoside deacetylase
MTVDAPRRLLLVHAHPDDESIATGVTMARYALAGAQVTLVTCTLGEEGEVLVPELEHLAAAHDDALGPHRVTELADAMRELGVTDHRFLGGAGRWRDSGMMGTPSNDRADAFWHADLLEATTELVGVMREVRPQVLVTYDDNGGYGHPDHIQAHRVATYGASLAAAGLFRPDLGAAWDIPKIYWAVTPRSALLRGLRELAAMGRTGFFGIESEEQLDTFPFVVDDAYVTARVEAFDLEPRKVAALRAHRSQIASDDEFYEMASLLGPAALGTEHYAQVKGPRGTHLDADGYESDLFDGVA